MRVKVLTIAGCEAVGEVLAALCLGAAVTGEDAATVGVTAAATVVGVAATPPRAFALARCRAPWVARWALPPASPAVAGAVGAAAVIEAAPVPPSGVGAVSEALASTATAGLLTCDEPLEPDLPLDSSGVEPDPEPEPEPAFSSPPAPLPLFSLLGFSFLTFSFLTFSFFCFFASASTCEADSSLDAEAA